MIIMKSTGKKFKAEKIAVKTINESREALFRIFVDVINFIRR